MSKNYPTGKAAIKKHNELVCQAMLDDGYTEDEINKMLAEDDKNPDPDMVALLKKLQAKAIYNQHCTVIKGSP